MSMRERGWPSLICTNRNSHLVPACAALVAANPGAIAAPQNDQVQLHPFSAPAGRRRHQIGWKHREAVRIQLCLGSGSKIFVVGSGHAGKSPKVGLTVVWICKAVEPIVRDTDGGSTP